MALHYYLIIFSIFCSFVLQAKSVPPTKALKRDNMFISPLLPTSRHDRYPRNVVKMNLSQIALQNLSFQYETAFHKNFSAGIGVNFVLKRTLPDFFSEDDSLPVRLPDPELKGWAITPEFRFYPGHKEERQAPHGFYMAAYLRYARYKLNSSYTAILNGQNYGYDFHATYSGVTGGLMFGYQWLIGRHLSVDLWIAGAGAGSSTLNAELLSRGFEMDASLQQQLRSTLEAEFEKLRMLHVNPEITTTPNSARASAGHVPMYSLRGLGLCIGFAF